MKTFTIHDIKSSILNGRCRNNDARRFVNMLMGGKLHKWNGEAEKVMMNKLVCGWGKQNADGTNKTNIGNKMHSIYNAYDDMFKGTTENDVCELFYEQLATIVATYYNVAPNQSSNQSSITGGARKRHHPGKQKGRDFNLVNQNIVPIRSDSATENIDNIKKHFAKYLKGCVDKLTKLQKPPQLSLLFTCPLENNNDNNKSEAILATPWLNNKKNNQECGVEFHENGPTTNDICAIRLTIVKAFYQLHHQHPLMGCDKRVKDFLRTDNEAKQLDTIRCNAEKKKGTTWHIFLCQDMGTKLRPKCQSGYQSR